MLFEPVNKLVVIEKLPEPKREEKGFLIPEKAMQPRYSVVKLLRAEKDFSSFGEAVGKHIVVQTALIDEIEFNGEKHYVISENGIVGILTENEL
jgi:co-chaperonin GroES (HSP10)